jgi:aromatic ring-cleaving dioxygenase
VSAAPYHAHIYYRDGERATAASLRDRLAGLPGVVFAGALRDGKVGPHPISQFEIHFAESALPAVRPILEASGLTVLVHPLTHDDLADHTTLADWIGTPIELDVSVLDPPGVNQGFARYGKTDF